MFFNVSLPHYLFAQCEMIVYDHYKLTLINGYDWGSFSIAWDNCTCFSIFFWTYYFHDAKLRKRKCLSFFFNLYFQETFPVIDLSLHNILPTNFLFIILTYLHQLLIWLTFRRYFISFSLVMLVDLNQYHETVGVSNDTKFEISYTLFQCVIFKTLTLQFVLILFCMILKQTVSFKIILSLIPLDCMLSCHIRV